MRRSRGVLGGLVVCAACAVAAPGAAEPHLALGVSAGQLGSDPVYHLRLAYYAKSWLGTEATLGHNPSGSVHAALHHVNAIALLPAWGPMRPFATAGLGTIHAFPGAAQNATSVTKLLFNAGGGALLSLRDDFSLRLEARSLAVLDQQASHRSAYDYLEWSAGIVFHRALFAAPDSDTGVQP